MTIFEFIADHYFYTFLLGIFYLFVAGQVLQFVLNFWNRFLRHLSVRKHGWPPGHLDTDGDWPPKDDK